MVFSAAAGLNFLLHLFGIRNDNREESTASPIESHPSLLEAGLSTSSQPQPQPQTQSSSSALDVAPSHPTMNLANGGVTHDPEPHQMDKLSWTALAYCLTAGLEFNSIFAQVGTPSNVSSRVQLLSLLLKVSLCLLIATIIFAKTHPTMALVMDRVGSAIVLISSIIAAMPTIPLYVSIGCAAVMVLVMILVYARQPFQRLMNSF